MSSPAGGDGALVEVQRVRLMTAMAVVCRRCGPGRVTVNDVVKQARVSRRTFYEIFDDRDDCLNAAVDEAVRRASQRVLPAYESAEGWEEATRAGIEAFLSFLDEDRTFGGLLVIDSLAGGEAELKRRADTTRAVAAAIAKGRRGALAPRKVSPLVAEGAVGGVLAILHSQLLSKPEQPVAPLAAELSAIVLSAFGGAPVAPARRPGAAERGASKLTSEDEDSFAQMGVRLTYRTLLVLRALGSQDAEAPGMANRDVADAAGIADQGQASKLLARLSRHGLIVNERSSAHRDGERNAWRLTERGMRVERAARRAGE